MTFSYPYSPPIPGPDFEYLGLPVYILTDSIPEDEVVAVRDRITGRVYIGPVGELLAPFFTPGLEKERIEAPLEVPSWNPYTGKIEWTPIGYAYRHYIEGEILEIRTRDRGTIRVTKGHSLFVFRNGEIKVLPAMEIKPGDHIIAARKLPQLLDQYNHLNAREILPRVNTVNMHDKIVIEGSGILYGLLNVDSINIKDRVDGSKRTDKHDDIIYSTRSVILAKQLTLLLLSLGVDPVILENGNTITIKKGRSTIKAFKVFDLHGYLTNGPDYKIPADTSLRVQSVKLASNTISNAKSINPGNTEYEAPSSYNRTASSDLTSTIVESVRSIKYKSYVYDFAVPGTNSFIGSYGILYHNSDPYGWYIYSVFKVGSIQLSYESERLATPKARFLGVSMTDIFGWRGKRPYLSERERRNFIIRAKDVDIRRAKELMRYSWFNSGKWRRELKIFLEKKSKLEIEALASKGLRFLAFQYIPEKIETGDWIE